MLGPDQDGARRRRAAAKKTLGTAQHFDLIQVIDCSEYCLRVRLNFIEVDINSRKRSFVGVERDAAQCRGVGAAVVIVELKSGRELRNILDVENLFLVKLVGRDGVDRHRDVLQEFGPPRGGDDDLLEPFRLFRR